VAALIVLAFVAMERQRSWRAALAVALGVCVKIFPLAALTFAIPRRRAIRTGLATAAVGAALVALPLVLLSPAALAAQYQSWRGVESSDAQQRWFSLKDQGLTKHDLKMQGIRERGDMFFASRQILFTGATFFKFVADNGWDKLFPYNPGEPFMAMSMHLNVISNQISQMPEVMKYGSAAVLIILILFVNSFAIALRVWLRSRKRW